MTKKVIVVDVDEVLFPMVDSFLAHYNQESGTKILASDMTTYFVQDVTGEPEEDVLTKLKAFLLTPHHQEALPIEGSLKAIKRLNKKYELMALTSRQDFFRGFTEQFINKHYPGIFNTVRYTHEPETPNVMVPKFEICRDAGAIAMIDDSLTKVSECAEHGIEGILFGSYAWNQTNKALPKGVTRCINWQQVAEHFGV